MRYFRRLLKYVLPYTRYMAASAVLTLGASLLGLLMPWPLKLLIDSVLGDDPFPAPLDVVFGTLLESKVALLVGLVVLGLLLALLVNVVRIATEFVDTKVHQYIMLDFRGDLFQHAQRLSLAFHDRQRSGELLFAINSQADAAVGLAMSPQPLVQNALMLVGMFVVTFLIDAQLALLALLVVPFLYYAVSWYARHIERRVEEVKKMEGESLSIISEAMSMIRVIMAFGREAHAYRQFREHGERAVDARVHLTVRQTMFGVAVSLTTAVGTSLVVGFGAYRVLVGQLTLGQLMVVMSYLASIYGPLQVISHAFGAFQDRFAAMRIAFSLLDEDPEIGDRPGAVDLGRVEGHVRFDGVSFSHTGRTNALSDISFEAAPGQVVGIVGPTGAGKSTLVSLLPRFYDVDEGRILVDGSDIRDATLRSLRRQIAVVLQDPLLFSGTIADNIRYGRLDATQEEIEQAARAANVHDFIMALSDGYETPIGERGARLSGGERQRISIARAFLKDAPVMILDEPTSSVDSRTESVILEALDRLMAGRTTFVIAHRLATIHRADLILVMDGGRIIERGTGQQLLLEAGLYKELRDLQAGQVGRGASVREERRA